MNYEDYKKRLANKGETLEGGSMKSLLTEEQRIATRTYARVANQMMNKMFEIGNSANDRSEAVEETRKLIEDFMLTPEISVPRNREMLDFAMEVIYQWGYEPEPGVYTSGGLSTLETAFGVLREYNMLDKNGRWDTKRLIKYKKLKRSL